MKIYNIGSLNIDYVYSVDSFVRPAETKSSEDMKIFPGGKGLNQSIALARAGAEVIHCGAIGQDGSFLLQTLKDSGVSIDRISVLPSPTGHAIIQVDSKGQNCILLFAGANQKITRSMIECFLSDAESNDILLIQNETNCLNEIIETAAEKQMQIAFNPSPFDQDVLGLPLHHIKWWFCNEIEGSALFGVGSPKDICASFLSKYPDSNLILTLGENGAIFCNSDLCITQPIFKANVVDTTAAGDTFTGYFLSAVAAGNDIPYALKLAAKASSITVSRLGASTSIPCLDEVEL